MGNWIEFSGIWTSDSTQRFYVPQDRSHVSHSIANLQRTSDFLDIECRSIPSVRAPILVDGAPVAAERPSPGLGQHTEEVLRDPAWGG